MASLNKDSRIFVSGHRGMVGSALVRRLTSAGYRNVVTRSRAELDLLNQGAVREFLAEEQFEYVFVAAAKVGGIQANNVYRADFLYENVQLAANLIEGGHRAGLQRLMFLGSSCIYPRDCPQPIREDYLLTGPLEQTNEPYALAKIAGVRLCEAFSDQYGRDYVSVMPTNLYGPNDNYDLANSHVLPALLRKAHEAKQRGEKTLTVWGTGTPRREFLHVDDLADACVFLMERNYSGPFLNVGAGVDISIADLARRVMDTVGLTGELRFDTSKPDGTPRKLLDVSKLSAEGWTARIGLVEGLETTYRDFLAAAPRL